MSKPKKDKLKKKKRKKEKPRGSWKLGLQKAINYGSRCLVAAKPMTLQIILIRSQVQIQAQNPSAIGFLHQRCRIGKSQS